MCCTETQSEEQTRTYRMVAVGPDMNSAWRIQCKPSELQKKKDEVLVATHHIYSTRVTFQEMKEEV